MRKERTHCSGKISRKIAIYSKVRKKVRAMPSSRMVDAGGRKGIKRDGTEKVGGI